MKRLGSVLLFIAALCLTCGWASAQSAIGSIQDRYIVQVQPDANPLAVAGAHGVRAERLYRVLLNGFAGRVPPGQLRALENDPRVVGVVPDRLMFAVAKPGGGGTTGGQAVPAGVTRIGAAPNNNLAFNGTGVGVAIVDTGLDFAHSDLNVSEQWFTSFEGTAQDDQGHGTHVGGTVAALNNGTDVVGVAPSATLYAVKVLDSGGTGSDAEVMAGLDWVAEAAGTVNPPIRVVNMSLGRTGTLDDNPLLRESIQNLASLGITVVVAAGNDCGLEVAQNIPAGYPEVIAVASTTAANGANKCRRYNGFIAADTASYFTTDGALVDGIGVTISAPGEDKEDISSGCFVSPVGILSTRLGGGTTRMYGTSMATPHVSGVVALLYQKHGNALTAESVRTKLRAGATSAGSAPKDSPVGCYTFDNVREGVLNATGALNAQ